MARYIWKIIKTTQLNEPFLARCLTLQIDIYFHTYSIDKKYRLIYFHDKDNVIFALLDKDKHQIITSFKEKKLIKK